MAEELSGDRQFALETHKIEADLEIRRAELEERRASANLMKLDIAKTLN
jgi:hypothetical protein